MAKAIGPLMSTGASKQLGKSLIFKQKGGKSFITAYNKPGGKNRLIISPTQLNKRMLYNLIIARWQTFSAGQKAVWNDDSRTKTLRISGWNLFYREALKDLPTYLGLQAYLSFNRIVNKQILDLSGNENHGDLKPLYPTNYPNLVNSINKKFGKASSFNGIDNYITASDSPSLDITGDITVSLWIKMNSKAPWNVLLTKSIPWAGDNGYGFFFRGAGATLNFFINHVDYGAAALHPTPSVGEWHHIVGTYDGSNVRIYSDGVEGTPMSYSTPIGTNNEDLKIGWDPDMLGYFDGLIDEVHIYNRALSEEEIQKHYNLVSKK